MAIKIKWQAKPPTKGNEEDKPQMFPRISDSEVVDVQKLSELVSAHSSLSKGTVIALLSDLPEVIAELLSEGKTIDIPSFGTFKLSIGTDAQIHPDSERRMKSVEVRGVNFLPSQDLMSAIGKPKFQWQSGTGVAIAPTTSQLIPLLEDYFKTHDSITRKEFQQAFGLKRSTAWSRLKELTEKCILRAVGSGRETVYKRGNASNQEL